jgi:ubiquinone/menaquinone biosynthesis C-methylase UbiE
MSAQYDTVGTKFIQCTEMHDSRPYTEGHTFFKLIGELGGKEVLDLACGHGYYTRQFKERGAAQVVGVDISDQMLCVARNSETQTPLGIKYLHCDVADMDVLGSFDVITAAQLFPYSPSREHLNRMCQRIYANLKPGGIFVGFATNPDLDPKRLASVSGDVTFHYSDPLHEGGRYTIEVRMGSTLTVECYYWSRTTYEQALKDAGFPQVDCFLQEIAPGAEAILDAAILQHLSDNPMYLFLRCTRPGCALQNDEQHSPRGGLPDPAGR